MKTKSYFLLFSILFASLVAHSQWTTDPAKPGIVCDFSGIQSNPTAFADDNGGVYVFWLDHRNGTSQNAMDVYGQHYNSDGYALWDEDGRMIMHHYKKISMFGVSRFDNGEMILGWITDNDGEFGDSLKFQRLDEDGMKLWPSDLLVSNTGFSPHALLGYEGYHIIHDNLGYCIDIRTIHYTGSTRNRITRFTSDGVLTGLYAGKEEGKGYGSSGLLSALDAGNNEYLYYSSGNSLGASLSCFKLSPAGDTIWGPVNVTSGTPGLNGGYNGFSDEEGITFIWNGNGEGGSGSNLYARRLNANGTFAWGGASTIICAADGNQSRFFARKKDDKFYVCWGDARPGTSPGNNDIYAQKFDVNGTVYWAENGIEVISLNTYIPYPEFAFSEANSMIVCHQSTGGLGFVAQKVLDDGTVAWGENGAQICVPAYNPFYAEHTEVQTGNKTIAVWAKTQSGGGSNDIFIARIDNLNITGESEFSASGFKVYPNPASENITVDIPEFLSNSTISLFHTYGRELFRSEQNRSSVLNLY